ncbi:MAG: hypothetical protein QNJ75_03195 [Acidimicrobiia bacterium]|nr:hypothetical protein [Acidimicrobiia bacterium]
MRKFVMLVAALGLIAGACGGDDAGGSCEAVADDAIDVFQGVIDEVDEMSLEEAAAMADGEPAFFVEMEQRFEELEAQADSLGCSDAEMEELFVARLDKLTADGMLGQMMLEEFRNQGGF